MRQDWFMFFRLAYFNILSAVVGNVMGVLLGNAVTGGGVKTIVQYLPALIVPFPILAGFVVNTGTIVMTQARWAYSRS